MSDKLQQLYFYLQSHSLYEKVHSSAVGGKAVMAEMPFYYLVMVTEKSCNLSK